MNPYAEYDNFDVNDPANERYTTTPGSRPDPAVPIDGCGACNAGMAGFGNVALGDGTKALFLLGAAAVLYFVLK